MQIPPNQVSFQANLHIADSKGHFQTLENAFSAATSKIKGDVDLLKDPNDSFFYNIKVTNHDKKTHFKKTIISIKDLEKSLNGDCNTPLRQILANLTDLMAKDGYGYGITNHFQSAFDKLDKTFNRF